VIAGLVVGAALGILVTVAVTTWSRRRREQALAGYLDEVAPPSDPDVHRPAGDVFDRARRVGGDLAAAVVRADERTLLFQRALDRMAQGIVVCDSEGRVVFTNDAGPFLADARHDDALVAAAASDGLRSALSGSPDVRSVELSGPPARTITVEAQPLAGVDEPIGAVALITDESRLRRLESVRSDFVANVSHELKTPIGGLALLAEALADALADIDIGSEQEQLAGRLLHEAHRVGRVVDDLLVLGEIEGELETKREPVAVAEIIDRTRAAADVLADGCDVQVVTSVVDDELWVLGDPVQLTSAFANLVENAIKYSGGASPVSLEVAEEGSFVRFTVADRGIGIPRRDLDRVFERFYRVDQARSQATGGTGLGLAIVRNVVQSHGGEIELSSHEGEGTTVVVRVPRATGRAGAGVAGSSSAAEGRSHD